MVFPRKLSIEQVQLIKDLAAQNIKPGMIFKQLITENKIPKDINYQTVLWHANKIIKPKTRRITMAQIDQIESVTQLCMFMANWVQGLKREYDNITEKKIEDEAERCPMLENELGQTGYALTPMFRYYTDEKKDLKGALNKGMQNFVEILKTPQIQAQNVNILNQQFQQTLKEIWDERPNIRIPAQ